MTWTRVSDTYHELHSRGNMEGAVKQIAGEWHCFLDAVDMVSLAHIGTCADLLEAKKVTREALSSHRKRPKKAA